MPRWLSRRLFNWLGILVWFLRTRGVRQLELNLSRVLSIEPSDSQLRRLSREGMRSYMRYYCETFLLPRWSKEDITKLIRTENLHVIETALKTGGAILTLPHSGNWDLAGAWAAGRLGSLCTVAERLRPEGVYQKFMRMRTQHNIELMPLTGDGGTYEWLREHVNQGRLVALLGDRDVAKSGLGVNFFHHRAVLPIGPALLAIDTGRPLITCSTWYDGDQLVITFDEPLVIEATSATGRDRIRQAVSVTTQVAQNFESHIKRHPSDWHMLQMVWPDLTAQIDPPNDEHGKQAHS